jgi:hypothetical protein
VTRRRRSRPRRRAADVGRAAPERAGWPERLARLGYLAKGVVYLVLGGSGLLVAVGLAERARGSPAAMRVVVRLPLGYVLGAALVVGLVGYAALSFVAAVRDPEGNARGVRGAALRLADACTGVAYTGLAATALRLLVDPRHDAGALGAGWSALLFRVRGGAAVLVMAGVVLVAIGAYLWVKAATAPFARMLERRRMRPDVARWVVRLARAGTLARGVLFALCGGMLARAGWRRDPDAVGDFGDALTLLGARPAGQVLLGLVALGCVAYGAYQIAKARLRRIRLG